MNFELGQEAVAADSLLTEIQPREESVSGTWLGVDASIEAFKEAAANVSTRPDNATVIDTLNATVDALSGIDEIRKDVRARFGPPQYVATFYDDAIDVVVDLPSEVGNITTDRELAQSLTAYRAIDVLLERVQVEKIAIERTIRRGSFLQGEAENIRTLEVKTDIALEDAQEAASVVPGLTAVPEFGASLDPLTLVSFETIRSRMANGVNTTAVAEQANDWPTQVSEELEVLGPIRDQNFRVARNLADSSTAASLAQTIFTALIAAAVVLASLFIALLIARRIVGPLRRLTTTATAVRQELPRLVERVALPGQTVDVSEVQIPVESSDEIGRLAEAFNAVNAATLSIAGEQAALRGSISEMFVNVARRDQVLLNRQLASIDEMERTQDDADTLQKLFALDHLATRMRRNSESLLVLAGIDTGRRMRRAMPLSDVVRTASSEIELYERIQLELDADPSMVGHSALTAAHLFAELLENATVFSDPGTPVTVRTSRRDGSFVVEIQDAGIGMGPEELQEANQRVLSTAASEILGAQRLGLFVVGRIARRVGARVELESKEGEGTTARVIMPASLFDASVNPEEHEPIVSSAVDEDMHAPSALVSHDSGDEFVETDMTAPDADAIPDESTPLPADPPALAPADASEPVAWGSPSSGFGPPLGADAEEDPVPASGAVPLPASADLDDAAPAATEEPAKSGLAWGLDTPDTAPAQDSPALAWGFGSPAPEPAAPEPDAPPRMWGFGNGDGDAPYDDSPIPVPDVPDEAEVTTADIHELIESDAASAPAVDEVDLEALTDGTTPSGLPTRRRAADVTEARPETTSVLGLPPRPSSGQIDEMSASARTGFVPKVSASEVAPQTAEQRASLFRGFQNTRQEEGSDEEGTPESLGFAARRSAIAPDAIPSLEDEESEDR